MAKKKARKSKVLGVGSEAAKSRAKNKGKKAAPVKRKRNPIDPVTGKRKRGRPKATSPKETTPTGDTAPRLVKQRDWSRTYDQKKSKSTRDIAPLPVHTINWERRLATRASLKLHCETYHKSVFYMGWSDDQLICCRNIEEVFLESSLMFALAMPRGGGKTALCRGGLQWGTGHGMRRFPFFIGATADKATGTLEALKTNWFTNPLLREDFPEIAYPVKMIENRYHLAGGQVYGGVPTGIEWGNDGIRYPSVLLPKGLAEEYLKHDPQSLLLDRVTNDIFCIDNEEYEGPVSSGCDLREDKLYLCASAGLNIGTAGIGGSVRGEAETHPITLEQPRPDLLLLDDVQKDAVAESPASVEKITRLIDGTIQGLAGPGEHIAALMPCTVIMEDDAADQYLDPERHPEWNGHRARMVISWPAGVTDYEVTQDTKASRHWLQYAELRRRSLKLHKNISLATEYYVKHQKVMDRGFKVSWPDRYDKDKFDSNGKLVKKGTEVSAEQHAMNLRLKSPKTFLAEFQNIGKSLRNEGEMLINADQLSKKTVEFKRLEAPANAMKVTAFIDVQNEIFFYMLFATDLDFNGVFCDYGTWPKTPIPYFSKSQTESWSLLTQEFFKTYPEYRDNAQKNSKGRVRAPFEAKMYHGLSQVVPLVQSKIITRMDEHRLQMSPTKIGIDTRWGQASDVIKRYIRESGNNVIVPYYGQNFPPTNRQLEEYEQRKGWMFEQQVNPEVKEPAWCIRPNPDGMFYMASDVDRGKDRLFQRLGSPQGSPGSISLFSAAAEDHQLVSDHICNSEYPEPVRARNLTKNKWTEREGSYDNDFLDCAVGCLQMASLEGVSLKTSDGTTMFTKRSLAATAASKSRRGKR